MRPCGSLLGIEKRAGAVGPLLPIMNEFSQRSGGYLLILKISKSTNTHTKMCIDYFQNSCFIDFEHTMILRGYIKPMIPCLPVLWIQIWSDPHFFGHPDPHFSKWADPDPHLCNTDPPCTMPMRPLKLA